MARHRDIRNMDFREDYDGYDDIYGHSVDDDYCISPSNRQYLYNRESSTRSSESDIKEEDELEAQLSDLERARLNSCIDQIKSTLGAFSLDRNELVSIIINQNYNMEKCIHAILEESTSKKKDTKEKGLTNKQMHIRNLNCSKNVHQPKTTFIIPNLFNKNSQEDLTKKKTNFIIPSFGKPICNSIPNFGSSPSNREYKSLSEVVSNHLETQVSALNEELKNASLNDETETVLIDEINSITINEPLDIIEIKPLPCSFDVRYLMKVKCKFSKRPTSFARVMCKHYSRPVSKVSSGKKLLNKRIKIFEFNTPSPDDGIKQYLRK